MIDQFIPDAEFDFHSFRTITPFEVEHILNEFLLDQYSVGNRNLLVITGKGAVIRPAAKKLLSSSELVKKFKTAGYFNGQDGAFEITLVG